MEGREALFVCFVVFIFGFVFPGPLSLLIAGSVLLPVGMDRQSIAKSADLETDFPAMPNKMSPAGSCKVIRMWFQSVERQEPIGRGNTRHVCYDEVIAEFAWNGGPSNTCEHCTGGRAQIQMIGDGNEGLIASSPATTRRFISVKHYGGWRAGAYQADPGDFTSVAISQAWEKRDGSGCTEDSHNPYRIPYNVEQEREMFNSTRTCRLPANGVDGVSEPYACPDTRYNSLCARLGDLPVLEIDVYGSAADGLVNAGARAAMRAPTTPRAPKCAWPGCPARSCPSITAYCPRVP
jgi:hypothetical protein